MCLSLKLKLQSLIAYRWTYIIILCIFLLISLATQVTRTARLCTITNTSSDATVTQECDPETFDAFCAITDSAFDLKYTEVEDTENGQFTTVTQVSCPWKARTTKLYYVSMGVTLVFLVGFTKCIKRFSRGTTIETGLLSMCLVLSAVVLMTADIKNGSNTTKELLMQLEEKNTILTTNVFTAGAVFGGFAFLMIAVFTFISIIDSDSDSGSMADLQSTDRGQEGQIVQVEQIIQVVNKTIDFKRRSHYVCVAIFFIFLVISFVIETQHTNFIYKIVKIQGKSKTTRFVRSKQAHAYCNNGAFDGYMTLKGKPEDGHEYTTELLLSCPWNITTSFFNYASLVTIILFMILFVRKFTLFQHAFTIGISLIAVCLTLVSVLLMGIDIENGYLQINKMANGAPNQGGYYTQDLLLANIASTGFALVILTTFAMVAAVDHRTPLSDASILAKENSIVHNV